MGNQSRSDSKNPLTFYFILSFIIAVPLLILSGSNISPVLQGILLLLASFVPTISAIIVSTSLNEQQTLTHRAFKLWDKSIWLGVSLLIPTASWLLVYLIGLLFNWNFNPLLANALAFPVIFFANFGEEIGWRGFALPRLLSRYTPLTSSLILGAVWTAFHAPLYWQRPLEGLLFLAPILPISVIITWLFLESKESVLITTTFHAVFNVGAQVLLTGDSTLLLLGIETLILIGMALLLVARLGKDYWKAPVTPIR